MFKVIVKSNNGALISGQCNATHFASVTHDRRHFENTVTDAILRIPFQVAKRVNVLAHSSQLELGHVDSNILLELFPFAVILDHDMRISRAGEKILETWILQNPSKPPTSFWGSRLVDIFKLRRPKGLRVDWSTVMQMHLVIFELELMRGEHDSDETEQHIAKSANENGLSLPCGSMSEAVEAAQTGKLYLAF